VTLAGFPRRTLRGDVALYRIHHRERGPWWFSSDGAGRFDPIGTGLGACYLAAEPLGAWVEVFRQQMQLSERAVSDRAFLTVTLGTNVRLADLTSRRALQFGVTASLGADEDYTGSHQFATRAVEAGFAGVRYFLRHDPAQKLYGIALFGDPAGTAGPAEATGADAPIPQTLVDEAQARFGYRIVPTP
jgi:RES domain-containing protein